MTFYRIFHKAAVPLKKQMLNDNIGLLQPPFPRHIDSAATSLPASSLIGRIYNELRPLLPM